MAAQTLELFPALIDVPPCSLCGTRGFRADCWRCELRVRLFHPSAEELADRAAIRAQSEAEAVARAEAAEQRHHRLAHLDRPVRVVLVGCGKAKAAEPLPARDLYRGSLFRAARAYAERFSDEWYVLSAAHGLVPPDRVLAPYDVKLAGSARLQRAAWGERVVTSLVERYHSFDVELTVLAGVEYAKWLRPHVPARWTLEEPLAGLGTGHRLAWLCQRNRDGANTGTAG